MTATLRLGSHRSPMAVAQSRQVAAMITERTGRQVEIVGVTTPGHRTGRGAAQGQPEGRAGGPGRRQARRPPGRGQDRGRLTAPGSATTRAAEGPAMRADPG
jgi:hypothetical protein